MVGEGHNHSVCKVGVAMSSSERSKQRISVNYFDVVFGVVFALDNRMCQFSFAKQVLTNAIDVFKTKVNKTCTMPCSSLKEFAK